MIVPASTFRFENQADVERYYEAGHGYLYSRYANPTVRQVESALAALEGAQAAACFASGMAAISTTFLALARGGERVGVQRDLYGGTVELVSRVLADLAIEVRWFERQELAALAPADLAGCCLLYVESPVNPTLRLVDLRRCAEVARIAGVTTVVDSTFAPPVVQRPIDLGFDLVVHSATKYLGGHGDLTGGVVAGREALMTRIGLRRRALGGTMDAFTGFLLLRGIRSLAVRVEAQCRGALAVASGLAAHPGVVEVSYPGLPDHPDVELARRQMNGFGGMVAFRVAGGAVQAVRVHDRLRLFARAASLGGVESLVSIPARMSHRHLSPAERAAAGVPDDLLRLSIGLEDPEDLLADLDQALA